MEVILLDNIEGLGKKGAVVTVKSGFGRNYLLPHKKAMAVTPDNLFRLRRLKKKFEAEEVRLLAETRSVAGRLGGTEIHLIEKATEEGHLFGSVTAASIRTALEEKGFAVSERAIRLPEHIKVVGTYAVPVHLHSEVEVSITVVVDAEGGTGEEEGEAAPAAEEPGADTAGDDSSTA